MPKKAKTKKKRRKRRKKKINYDAAARTAWRSSTMPWAPGEAQLLADLCGGKVPVVTAAHSADHVESLRLRGYIIVNGDVITCTAAAKRAIKFIRER